MAKESITIAGSSFDVPNPYAAGHQITAGEADALNQTFHENVRNNLAKKAKEGTLTQTEVDDYCKHYEFGVRTGGGRSSDPVRVRAMDIARDKVRQRLREKFGKAAADYTAKQVSEAAATALEKHPEWMDLAREQIEAERQIAEDTLDDIVDSIGEPNEPEAATEAAAAPAQ